MPPRRLVAAVAAVCFGPLSSSTRADRYYGVLDLGIDVSPQSLNDSGIVVGSGPTATGGFRTSPYAQVDPVADQVGGTDVFAVQPLGVNNSGQTVGWFNYSDDRGITDHGFTYDGTTFTDIGGFAEGSRTLAYAINNATSPQITGASDNPDAGNGFLYQNGIMVSVGPNAPSDLGEAVNDLGQVAGTFVQGFSIHSFFTGPNGSGVTDLGTMNSGNGVSEAHGINNSGDVVGYSDTTSGERHGYFYNHVTQGIIDLGTLGSTGEGESNAAAINNSGIVVGFSTTSYGLGGAMRWTAANGMQDLNDLIDTSSPWYRGLNDATDVNGIGQIVGNGSKIDDSNDYGYMLIPIPQGDGPHWNVDQNGNWSNNGNWSDAAPNYWCAHANFLGAITNDRTVTVDTPVRVGYMKFDNSHSYILAGSNTITIDNLDLEAQVTVVAGSHQISAPGFLRTDTKFDIPTSRARESFTSRTSTHTP